MATASSPKVICPFEKTAKGSVALLPKVNGKECDKRTKVAAINLIISRLFFLYSRL
jgi:hypothetical protein